MVTGDIDDPVLDTLIELTLQSDTENRPLFPNLIDEPIFYRKYFKRWVHEGLLEYKATQPKAKTE